jgi:hypothetical protein
MNMYKKMTTKVYIVIRGEWCETSRNLGVFTSLEKARDYQKRWMDENKTFDGWSKENVLKYHKNPGEDEYMDGCDYTVIEEHELDLENFD